MTKTTIINKKLPSLLSSVSDILKHNSNITGYTSYSRYSQEIFNSDNITEIQQLYIRDNKYKEIHILQNQHSNISQFVSDGNIDMSTDFFLVDISRTVIKNSHGFDTLLSLMPYHSEIRQEDNEWVTIPSSPRYFITRMHEDDIQMINVFKRDGLIVLPTSLDSIDYVFSLDK